MKCKEYQDLFIEFLNNELTAVEQTGLKKHLSTCAVCNAELTEIQKIVEMVADLPEPEPSAEMKFKFDHMLHRYELTVNKKQRFWLIVSERFRSIWQAQPRWPLTYNLVLLTFILSVGYWFLSYRNITHEDKLQQLSSQVNELKQTMMLAMLDNPSASQRMRAVSYATDIRNADHQVIKALLATLNNDSNVNVRLITLDALVHFASYPEVREGLILSINEQESPLMQSAIADAMVKLQERRSIKSFKRLLKQKELDRGVRTKINETINSLI